MTTAIILDCDPGNDDALAILVAAGHPALDLIAVTTVAGHLDAARTARNAAITIAMARSARVPVAAGATVPLVRERLVAAVLDMESGLDRERPDLPAVALDRRHAIDVIAEAAAARPGLVIAATGPLTNLALALRRRPELSGNLGGIVTLGGAWGLGNKTAAAEWNILSDPEAAAVVYGSGVPITMVPIDAAATVAIDTVLIDDIARRGGTVCGFGAELLRSLQKTHRPRPLGPHAAPLNDPLALLIAAEPHLARTLPARVDIETANGLTYGRTVVDFNGRGAMPTNCAVVVDFDVAATRAAFVASLVHLAEIDTVLVEERRSDG